MQHCVGMQNLECWITGKKLCNFYVTKSRRVFVSVSVAGSKQSHY